ncbi:MAG: hypothetical protein ACTSSI_15590 [Candidatus Helarchaeota archaeon]
MRISELETLHESVLAEIESFRGRLRLHIVVKLILSIYGLLRYNPITYELRIGWQIRYSVIVNRIRELALDPDFFILTLPNMNQKLVKTDEFKFISKLFQLYDLEKQIENAEVGNLHDIYSEDLRVYRITSNSDPELRKQIDLEEKKRAELEKQENSLDDISNLENECRNARIQLKYLLLKIYEAYLIEITVELTKEECIKFKDIPGSFSDGSQINEMKFRQLGQALYDLLQEIKLELAHKNAQEQDPEKIHLVLKGKDAHVLEIFMRNGLSIDDYEDFYDFFLCPIFLIGPDIWVSENTVENFLIYIKYHLLRPELNNIKISPFEDECFKFLSRLEEQDVIVKRNQFRNDLQIDFLCYNPIKNEIVIIECTDMAPLYFPFIKEKKLEIQHKIKDQLEKRSEMIENNRDRIKNIFNLENGDFHVKLVGISRISCPSLHHIRILTLKEVSANPKSVLE